MGLEGRGEGGGGGRNLLGHLNSLGDYLDSIYSVRTSNELSLFLSRVVKSAKNACVPKLKSPPARRLFLSL